MAKFFGTPDGIRVGQQFVDRRDLQESYVHRPGQAGIHGNRSEGADSIVLSGGYKDDRDYGDYIIYTGHGGNKDGRQIADQSIDDSGNAGLITSKVQGFPVRVIRGSKLDSPYAPAAGFVYAGLYEVADFWTLTGVEGFQIVQFRLVRIPEQPALVTRIPTNIDPIFATTTVSRRIRDTAMSRQVKKLYNHHCQICSTTIVGIEGRAYSEGAHVRPLGNPHLGADSAENLLCLCPNHHTQLDMGGLVIFDNLSVANAADSEPFAELTFKARHRVDRANLAYQREYWARMVDR